MLNDTPKPTENPLARDRLGVQRLIWGLVALALLLGAWGIVSLVPSRKEMTRESLTVPAPLVSTVHPTPSPPSEDLVVPGNVQAFIEVPIYPRISGYLRRWYTNVGAAVKKGQLLAEMDIPDIDQQLRAAERTLASARASARRAARASRRWQALLAEHVVSRQAANQRAAAAQAAAAAELAARGSVEHLRQLESLKRVTAPFDGVVTYRSTGIGALVSAGDASETALLRVANTQTLRIYVQIPEPYAPQVRPGVVAELEVGEHPQKTFPAMVVRTAEALDPTARTLQVELHVDNREGELQTGDYANVHFRLPGLSGALRIPATALLFRPAGLQVATVGPDLRVKLKGIVQGRNFGGSVEVLSGLTVSDNVIASPPDGVTDGTVVRLATPPAPAAGPLP